MVTPTPTVMSQEALLLDYARRLERHRQGRRALHVHLSRLRPYNRRDHHIRIAASVFEPLIRRYEGTAFLLHDGDIVFVARNAPTSELDGVLSRLRYLFSDDPLTKGEDAEGQFATWYDIDKDYGDFLAMAEKAVAMEESRRERAARDERERQRKARPHTVPLNPDTLADVERTLSQADLSVFMRRQPVCAVLPDNPPQPVFRELYISIADLQQQLVPHVDLLANRWLFQHLTEVLDRRMLAMLAKSDDTSISRYISINLNVSTLLTPEFLAFDAMLRQGTRGTVVLELQTLDLFGDMASFHFARDFVHDRGYRLCLDGLTAANLPYVQRESLGLDLLKVMWSGELADLAGGDELDAIKANIQAAGPSRVILTRCDSEDAIRFGRDLGINLFQGHHVDALLVLARKDDVHELTMKQAMARGRGER